jgi:7-carboxy-7-deazaguanine synthase
MPAARPCSVASPGVICGPDVKKIERAPYADSATPILSERTGPGGGSSPRQTPDRIREHPLVVCTGGEPLLQLGESLIEAFHGYGFTVAIETNGTRLPPRGVDWVCVSPKAGAKLVLRAGNELKLIYPQPGAEPEKFIDLDFQHFFLQPMDGPERQRNTQQTVLYCLAHPQWRLSLQTHKLLGIP